LTRNKTNYLQYKFGFTSDPYKKTNYNFQEALKQIEQSHTVIAANQTSKKYTNKKDLILLQPKNLAMHNLCQGVQPPPGTKNLLGLGLKFCLAPPNPTPNAKDTLLKLAYKIRTKHYLDTNGRTSLDDYIPQLYIKLKGWNPPPAASHTETLLHSFETKLKEAIQNNTTERKKFYNLTKTQANTLKLLKNSKEFIILPSDKNLGPTIMNYHHYVEQVLREHLLTPNYQHLSQTLAHNKIEDTKQKLKDLYRNNKNNLIQAEINYFKRSFGNFHRTPVFYGMPKVHKSPMTLRPVVSCINSFVSIFSTWLDFRMKELLHLIPSYIKDSKSLISEITILDVPIGAKLFTADATAMYSNIDIDTGLDMFKILFDKYKDSIPLTFPIEFFLSVLEIVMRNNIFTFGDTHWLQTTGTAMGTPAAPLYSIITFGIYENTQILNRFHRNIFYYKRYIDDVFGIWLNKSHHEWDTFKTTLNKCGKLQWNVEELNTNTTFLDLQIWIQNNKIHTKTYQKDMNLYTYIPPLSAHPSSCFKGLITGELLRYWNQNSNKTDFQKITTQFIQRLLDRGHKLEDILPIITSAAAAIDNRASGTHNRSITNHTPSSQDDILYIHWRHHPHGLQRQQIRDIYNNTLKDNDGFTQMRVALSRHKNLRETLCRSQLDSDRTDTVSEILRTLR